MNFYEILKTKKLGRGSPDYWTQLFAEHVGGKGEWAVAELTGTLPMTFRSNGTALINYRIYGTAEGAGVQTENLFDISSVVDGYINAYGALTAGSLIQAEKTSDYIEIDGSTTYTFSAVGGFPSRTGYAGWRCIAYFDSNKRFLERRSSEGTSDLSATSGSTAKYVRISYRSYGKANLQMMLVKGSTTPSTYIPYGYQIPLTVTSGTESKTADIYIGDSKLLAEEYVDYEEQKVHKRTKQLMNCSTIKGGVLNEYGAVVGADATSNIHVDNSSVSFTTGSVWRGIVTDFIEIKSDVENVTLTYGGDRATNWRFCFYDNLQTFISQSPYVDRETRVVAIPNNTKYFRAAAQFETAGTYSLTSLSIVKGSTPPETYIPYIQPTDPPLPLPALETFEGTNTLDCTETLGEVTIKGQIKPQS